MHRSSAALSIPVVVAALALAVALPATPCRAQSADWNQTRVTELAVQLSDAVAELQSSFRREAPLTGPASAQSRARFRFADSLRVARTETRALASQLESGAGLDETWPIARRLRMVIRDMREEGRRMSWKEPVLGHAQRAEELIAQIAPFYFETGEAVGAEEEGKSGG